MARWFRVYDDLVDDPKVQKLPPDLFKSLINLWCLASQNEGRLPSQDDIGFKLRMKPARVAALLADLERLGLIDREGSDARPHNWDARQFKSDVSTERVQRFRKRPRNVSSAVSETPPETEQIQNQKGSEAYASAAVAAVNDVAEPADEDAKARLYRIGKTILVSFGVAEKRTGALIGQWLKTGADATGLLAAIQYAREQNVADPVAYVSVILKSGGSNGKSSGGDRARELAEQAERAELARGISRPAPTF